MGSQSLPTSEDKPARGCRVSPSSAPGAGRGGWQSRAAVQHLPPHLWMQTPRGICLTPQAAGRGQGSTGHQPKATAAPGQGESLVGQDHCINNTVLFFFLLKSIWGKPHLKALVFLVERVRLRASHCCGSARTSPAQTNSESELKEEQNLKAVSLCGASLDAHPHSPAEQLPAPASRMGGWNP